MGEVPRQQGCDAFDTRNRALTETTRTKVRLHFLTHRLPLGVGDLRRDTATRAADAVIELIRGRS